MMIYGIGVDIVSIERMEKAVGKWGERFLRRVFTPDEVAFCFGRKNPFPSLSVRFAAKEAFIKAVGGDTPFPFKEIEVMSEKSGKPSMSMSGRAGRFMAANNINRVHLTLSHEREFGIACVMLETGLQVPEHGRS